MILKDPVDLKNIRRGGIICREALKLGLSMIKPGVKASDIDNAVHKYILSQGATPSFLNYDAGDGPFPASCCLCINYELVHGLPSDNKIISEGDIVTIDVGAYYGGLHTDTAWTIEVGTSNSKHFLNAGIKALKAGIKEAKPGNRTGAISNAMQTVVESNGYNVSRDLVGHGLGHKLHEEPQILCYGKPKSGAALLDGMLIAVEVMYMQGNTALVMGEDGFSIDTEDYSLSAQFEHTLLLRKNKLPEIIV